MTSALTRWDDVTRDDVLRAIQEDDRLGPEQFFSEHGFGPTAVYDLVWNERPCPSKAHPEHSVRGRHGPAPYLQRFEGGKSGAVPVPRKLGFMIEESNRQGKPAGS